MSAASVMDAVSGEPAEDPAAEARRARFGRLPERIRFEDMTGTAAAGPGAGSGSGYDPDGSFRFYNCLAVDLAL
ncbi:hypothetical protein ACFVFS_13455 [Kitasatospora sp. NPDC057692]|uniref:hypothetical protein n=1 Tax=Kitasatospora sp. NPDC057692 TaxID=3346215 RepID=UPI0036BEC8F0